MMNTSSWYYMSYQYLNKTVLACLTNEDSKTHIIISPSMVVTVTMTKLCRFWSGIRIPTVDHPDYNYD